MSKEASRTFFFSFSLRRLAILPVVVVLPEPCKPTIITTAGGCVARFKPSPSPKISTNLSLTILTTCSPGLIDFKTFSPTASSFTFLINVLITGRATSASSSAMRISRIAASISFSDSTPRPVSFLKTPSKRPES